MPTRSKSQITTNEVFGRRLPRKRPPTHPGEMLFEEFVKPLELTQSELARRLGVSYPRLNEIIKGRRSELQIPHCGYLVCWVCQQIFGWVYSRIGIFGTP